MNRIVFSVVFLTFVWLPRLVATPIKIASWNVENLFDAHYDGTEYEEYVPGKHGWSRAMLEKKLNHLSEVICDLDAQIIALEEVENDRVLALLQKRLKRVGCAYPYRYITHAPPRTPVHVALLSRIRLKQRRDLRIAPAGRYRSILEAVIPGSHPLHLFVNHWRSKSGPESERVLYARALVGRLKRLPPGSEYILLGDFNSDYQEFRIIDRRHNDTRGMTGINQILGTSMQGHMVRKGDFFAPSSKGRMLHYNLWMELPAAKRWSHNFYGDKEAIDAMLLPPSLFDGRGWEYVPESFGVYRPSYLFGRYGQILRWEYRHGHHTGRGYSDHLPIFASFENSPLAHKATNSSTRLHRVSKSSVASVTVAFLNRQEGLKKPVLLKGATVLFRRGRVAVVQQRPEGEAILIYGAAAGLEEGVRYDLEIYGMKRYRGMPEITDLEIIRSKGRGSLAPFVLPFDPDLFRRKGVVSKVLSDVEGIYRHGMLYVGKSAVPIHFKKRKWIPAEGAKIMIKRAQIGYYKNHKELVVWDRRDYESLEKKEGKNGVF